MATLRPPLESVFLTTLTHFSYIPPSRADSKISLLDVVFGTCFGTLSEITFLQILTILGSIWGSLGNPFSDFWLILWWFRFWSNFEEKGEANWGPHATVEWPRGTFKIQQGPAKYFNTPGIPPQAGVRRIYIYIYIYIYTVACAPKTATVPDDMSVICLILYHFLRQF